MTATDLAVPGLWERVVVYRRRTLYCETPECGTEEQAGPGTAEGWRLDFLGRYRCPGCAARCVQEPQPGEDATFENYEVLPGPRWAACMPARRAATPAESMYPAPGEGAKPGDYQPLFDALDQRMGAGMPEPVPPAEPMPAEPMPVPEVAHDGPPLPVITEMGAEDERHMAAFLDGAGEEHMAAFLEAHGVHDGATTAFPAVPELDGEPA